MSTPPKTRVCVLDWDDTILCSDHIRRLNDDTTSISTELKQLDDITIDLFQTIVSCGYQLYIITNSETGWVELTSIKYLPKIREYLITHKVPVISACSTYQNEFKNDPLSWKTLSFLDLVSKIMESNQLNSIYNNIFPLESSFTQTPSISKIHRKKILVQDMLSIICNDLPQSNPQQEHMIEVLSIGDSTLEQDAATRLTTMPYIPTTIVKIIKLIERPDIQFMLKQMNYMIKNLSHISSNINHLDVLILNPPPLAITMDYFLA